MAVTPTIFEHKVLIKGGWRRNVGIWGHIQGQWRPVIEGWSRVDGAWKKWVTVGTPATSVTHTGSHVKPPVVHATAATHRATVTASISRGRASWHIPAGRHLLSQYITYVTGMGHILHDQRKNLSTSTRNTQLLAGAASAVVHYVYR